MTTSGPSPLNHIRERLGPYNDHPDQDVRHMVSEVGNWVGDVGRMLGEADHLLRLARRAGGKLDVSRRRGEGGPALHRYEFDELIMALDEIHAWQASHREVSR